MKLHSRPLLTAIPALFAAGTALADVSAKDVWESYKAQLEMGGATVTATETQSGDTLTVTDLTVTTPASDVNFKMTMPEIAFREVGDGTVELILDPNYPMDVTASGVEGMFSAQVLMTSEGLSMTASGDPGDIKYDYSAAQLTVGIAGASQDGKDLPFSASFSMTDSSGSWTVDSTNGTAFVADMIAASMDFVVEASNPESSGETLKLTGTAQDIKIVEEGVFPSGADMQNLSAAIAAGFDFSGNFTTGAADYVLDVTGPDVVSGHFKAATSAFGFDISGSGLSYQTAATGLDFALSGSAAMPPIAGKLDEYALGLTMPAVKSDEPQDLSLLVKLVGLTVGEEIWGMFDPGKVLPRDPATLVLDLSGKGKLTTDIFDPTPVEVAQGYPVEMESLDINEVHVAAAGLDVSGTGALTFDNSGTGMGMPPMPIGKVDLVAIGVNGFLDNLVAMGFVTQEDLFPAKMMIGMYAKPGSAPDSLETTVEMTPGGGLTVNGMPLQ